MDPNDPQTYVLDQYAYNESEDPFKQGIGKVWPFGKENWCNLEGRYLHLVADMTQQLSQVTDPDTETISVCSIGVYGTKYVRSSEVPSSLELVAGDSKTISIDNISSFFTLGNDLAINMRQSVASAALDFVTFTETSNATDVHIDSTGLTGGQYTLTLESFNTLSVAQSALKTDTIQITIRVPPSFVEELESQVITVGVSATWPLPEI